MALVMAAFWSAAILGILTAIAVATWRLFLWISERGIESVRTNSKAEQIGALHRRIQRLLELEEIRKKEVIRSTFTNLEGKRVYLSLDEKQRFKLECQQVLGLNSALKQDQKSIRQHWRRNVIQWHPDQGGDAERWLIKLRAYEALLKMEKIHS